MKVLEAIRNKKDIVIFGKKTQLSGIMAKEHMGEIFSPGRNIRLEVTWDGDVSDMIRCKYTMKAYKEYNILSNVSEKSKILIEGLSQFSKLKNLRNCGLIVGFDLKNSLERDTLVSELFNNGLLCNSTGEKSIRLRPNLNLSNKDIDSALKIFSTSL